MRKTKTPTSSPGKGQLRRRLCLSVPARKLNQQPYQCLFLGEVGWDKNPGFSDSSDRGGSKVSTVLGPSASGEKDREGSQHT